MSSRLVSRRQVVGAIGVGLPAAVALGACGKDGSSGGAPPPPPARERDVARVIDAQPTTDGAGVKLRRSLGSRALPILDPFLMLDEFYSERGEDYIKGFPDHPHRGFETVTYMIHGAMAHRDSLGNHGRLRPGSVQWMTAGRGIIHSEMPEQEDGLMWGFQLWVNLPAAHKMTKPRYQDLAADQVVEVAIGDASVRLIAGEAGGKKGPVDGIVTAPQMLDVKLPAGGKFSHPLPPTHNAFAYVFEGSMELGPYRKKVNRGQLAVLAEGDVVTATSQEGGRMLLLAGKPIGEPVARYGPFVMNTEAELRQAFEDYRTGKLVSG